MAVLSPELVQFLARRGAGEDPVVSLYLNVDGREQIRAEDYLAHLDALIRDTSAERELSKNTAEVTDKIREYVANDFERGNTRGLAVFASKDDLWEVIPLPVSVEDKLMINSTPYVRDLETILDEHEPIGVLLSDKQRARLLIVQFGRVIAREEIVDPLPRHDDDGGNWRKDHVKTHATAIANQHLKNAASAMFDFMQRQPFTYLVLCVVDEIRPELERQLHAYLRSRLVGSTNLPVLASDDEIVNAAQELAGKAERKKESQYVERLRAAVFANESAGRMNGDSTVAVAGLEHTLKAVFDKRVDTLLVSEGFSSEGWRCRSCGYIATRGRTCAMCSTEMELVSDVIEEAVEDALGQSCRVEFCRENADLDVLGRIGALLRF